MKKRPTLTDVAKAAGVSRSAAAKALLNTGGDQVRVAATTRTRIEAAAKQMHYAPNRLAQQLRQGSSKTIGVILDSINVPVMSQRLFALEAAASRKGYRLLVGQTHCEDETLEEYVADFAGRGTEAILCLFDLAPGRDERATRSFGAFRKVVFHGRAAWPGGYAVQVDTQSAIHRCVDHLAARGKKNPALSLWNAASDELMALRRTAFVEQTKQHGMKNWVWDAAADDNSPTTEILIGGIDFMVGQCHADAILASNDIWATRYILELQKKGLRVPEDVAVIGYDNLDIAEVVSPSLTTIDQCHQDYANKALELLLEIADGRKIPAAERTRKVNCQLIERGSA